MEADLNEPEALPLSIFTERSYLDYSMYVINDRALPHIADGLKPVQRRIVYAMSEIGLSATAKYAKSARAVGDVLGNYHPHGDSACYEAMVLMAQPFSYRYPLIDGQGNWGAPDDPKSFAAMRYTEARLSRYAELLLREVKQGTVDFVPNFDNSKQEPRLLPARLPFALLNGSTGIAVGMATDLLPHNMKEVVSACVHLLASPKATTADLMTHVQGPDFPSEAQIITPKAELQQVYETGRGTVKARAVYTVEQGEIVITALPYQSSPAKVIEQIAAQMNGKNLPMLTDLRDESDHENPTRLVLVPRSNRVDVDRLMSHLFATTDLERSYRVNMNLIGLDQRPGARGLLALLTEWLTYRRQTVTRRLTHRVEKLSARLHIIDGLLLAYLNIDEVIRIIREEDDPKASLMARFKLSDRQTEAILDLRLRRLAKLEEVELKSEKDTLKTEKIDLEKILASKARMTTLMKKELLADAEEYGDARRSPLAKVADAEAFSEEDLQSNDPITVVLSEKGWIRSAKGHEVVPEDLSYRGGDGHLTSSRGRSNELLVLLDSVGRSYSLAPHSLPSARGQGEPLTGRLKPPAGARFTGLLLAPPGTTVLLASSSGYGFLGVIDDMVSKNKAGKAYLSVAKDAEALPPQRIVGELATLQLAAATNQGRLLLFPLAELPQLPRGKGNRLINIPSAAFKAGEESLVGVALLAEGDELLVYAGARHRRFKQSELAHYFGDRALRGRKLPRGYQKVDQIVASSR